MYYDISYHEAFFARYSQSFCDKHIQNKAMLELKKHHTAQVVRHMFLLVQKEKSLIPHAYPCLLASLYHDIGRFEQFSRYGTFKDADSINHATLGAEILEKENILKNENDRVRKQVFSAVAMHNCFALPDDLDDDIILITNAVRDADKLDILRVMFEHFIINNDNKENDAVTFYAKDEPSLWSQKIVDDVLKNRLASYNDIVYINDFKILLASWIHDITFDTTKQALVTSGYLENILDTLPHNTEMQKVQQHVNLLLGAVKHHVA